MKEVTLVSPKGDALNVGDFALFLIDQIRKGTITEGSKLLVMDSIDKHSLSATPLRRAWLAPMNSMLVLCPELIASPVPMNSGLILGSDMTVTDILEFIDEALSKRLINVDTVIGIFHSFGLNSELNIIRAKAALVPLGGGAAIVSSFTREECFEAVGFGNDDVVADGSHRHSGSNLHYLTMHENQKYN